MGDGWEDLTAPWNGVEAGEHCEYSMQMIGMGETRMTTMGGVNRECSEKICLNR